MWLKLIIGSASICITQVSILEFRFGICSSCYAFELTLITLPNRENVSHSPAAGRTYNMFYCSFAQQPAAMTRPNFNFDLNSFVLFKTHERLPHLTLTHSLTWKRTFTVSEIASSESIKCDSETFNLNLLWLLGTLYYIVWHTNKFLNNFCNYKYKSINKLCFLKHKLFVMRFHCHIKIYVF
jgi:hypothetical protein